MPHSTQRSVLSEWPVARPRGWTGLVDAPQTDAGLEALRRSVNRGRPYGDDTWTRSTATALGLQSSLRARGRPRTSQKNHSG